MNVIGTRPDAWWKDRHAAMVAARPPARELGRRTGEDVTVVFEQPPRPPISSTVIEVAHAPRPRRDSADDEIVRRSRGAASPAGPRRDVRRLARPIGCTRPAPRSSRRTRSGRSWRPGTDGTGHTLRTQRRGEHRLSGGRRGRTRPAVPDRAGSRRSSTSGRRPANRRFLERLATFGRLILFDSRGTGLSERVLDDVHGRAGGRTTRSAVLDAAG